MVEVNFNYEGNNTNIQCDINDKIKDIINKFLIKINKNENTNLYYLYNGNKIKEELTFYEQANQIDKDRNKMNVIVYNSLEEPNIKKEIISKDIICLNCKEICLLDINDYKINFHNCINEHVNNNILLNNYEYTQRINLNEITCDICKKYNKNNTHNNDFYICNNCNKNICPLCRTNHDESHNIINYDDKNYICKKHNDIFNKFCKKCNENICIICENEHNNHEILDLSQILIKKDDLNKIMNELKESIDKYKFKINIIKEIFDKMINIMDIYYRINAIIINNYNMNKRNYYKLLNIYNLKNNNEMIIKDLNNIINNDNISEIYNYSFNNFYNENGEKYIGEIKNGLKDGKGILYYNKNDKNNRKKYEGNFKNDKREGKGIFYWNNGDKYEGDWKNDIFEGKGIYYWNDGNRYEGDFKNDKREGKGIIYWENGNRYEGDFKNNEREGKGIMYYNNNNRYEGEFKNDKKEGKGTMFYNNGDKYEGDFKNDKKEGKGKMFYNNGDKYEGDFINDKKEGKGIYYFNNGCRYEGNFKNDKKNGKGIMFCNNGKIKKIIGKTIKFK